MVLEFATQAFQGGERRLAFRLLLAFAFAAAEFDALVIDRAFEKPVMVRTAERFELVLRRFGRVGLEDLLQFPLGIFQIGNDFELSEFLAELAENEIAGGVKARIEKDRAQ